MAFLDILEFFSCVPEKQEEPKPEYKTSGGQSEQFEIVVKDGMPKDYIDVKIKGNEFDVNRIKEYKGEGLKKFEFRPVNFAQFIGQETAKGKAKTVIKKVDRGIKSHILITGTKGLGKTTFVELLAKELNAKLIERVGKQVNEENLVDLINAINTSKEKNVILFIDELDSMDKTVIKVLNPIIESFKIAGKKIKPFIFAGATINKHILLKNNPDTLDRIGTHIKFKKYSAEEIGKIIMQYKKQLYSKDTVSQEVINSISENCKFNPRSSIALLEDYIVEKNMQKVLENSDVVCDGLTTNDIKILKALRESKRAIGANALAMRVGLSEKEYLVEYESYLIEYGYMDRIPSRVLSKRGKEFLKNLDNEKL